MIVFESVGVCWTVLGCVGGCSGVLEDAMMVL